MNITVVEHSPYWKEAYQKEEHSIREVLHDELVNSFQIAALPFYSFQQNRLLISYSS